MIGIKSENQGEMVVEISKDKMSPEKIKKNLLQKLDLSNPNDPYFIVQTNTLCNLFQRRVALTFIS